MEILCGSFMKTEKISFYFSNWSKREHGDTFAVVKEYEENVRIAEKELINNNSEENRSKLHRMNAEYIRYLKMEKSILKQKTQL